MTAMAAPDQLTGLLPRLIKVEGGEKINRLKSIFIGLPELLVGIDDRITRRLTQTAMTRSMHEPIQAQDHIHIAL